ncbi:MAG: copper amine oxidase N-terminal domain-containing protein [Clostridiales bacterium]|jgi:hypothetical protein|nr:copper amine oxidase N-terminal domain-containing protein [Clostridiales bacterium]
MKIKRKLLSMALVLVFVLVLSPITAFAGETEEFFRGDWEEGGWGGATITNVVNTTTIYTFPDEWLGLDWFQDSVNIDPSITDWDFGVGGIPVFHVDTYSVVESEIWTGGVLSFLTTPRPPHNLGHWRGFDGGTFHLIEPGVYIFSDVLYRLQIYFAVVVGGTPTDFTYTPDGGTYRITDNTNYPDEDWTWFHGSVLELRTNTPFESLGTVRIDRIGDLWWWYGSLRNHNFTVIVVDDGVEWFDISLRWLERTFEFTEVPGTASHHTIFPMPGVSDGSTNLGQRGLPQFGFYVDSDFWRPQIVVTNRYTFNNHPSTGEAGWMSSHWSYIFFTQSQIAEFQRTGNLPPLSGRSGGEDLSSRVDLSELIALLSTEQPSTQPTTATPSSHNLQINGAAISPTAFNIDGSNFFMLRDVAYMLNGTSAQFEVTWDGGRNAINLVTGRAYTPVGGEMAAGNAAGQAATPTTAAVYINGAQANLTAFNIGGNNFFMLRDLGEALGFYVGWDNATSTIIINTN